MEPGEIQQLLKASLPDCEISVQGGDGKYQVTVIGDIFEGLNQVKRNQAIYKILNEHIVSGAIHAVSMKLETAAERGAS